MGCHLLQFRPVGCYSPYTIYSERWYFHKSNPGSQPRYPAVKSVLAIGLIHVSDIHLDSLEGVAGG